MAPSSGVSAFLRQAGEDLRAAEALARQGVEHAPSTLCMLLQMVFEKIGEAVWIEHGANVDDLTGHRVLDTNLGEVQRILDVVTRKNSPQSGMKTLRKERPSLVTSRHPPSSRATTSRRVGSWRRRR